MLYRVSKPDLRRLARLLRVAQPVRRAIAEGVYQSIVVWFGTKNTGARLLLKVKNELIWEDRAKPGERCSLSLPGIPQL